MKQPFFPVTFTRIFLQDDSVPMTVLSTSCGMATPRIIVLLVDISPLPPVFMVPFFIFHIVQFLQPFPQYAEPNPSSWVSLYQNSV